MPVTAELVTAWESDTSVGISVAVAGESGRTEYSAEGPKPEGWAAMTAKARLAYLAQLVAGQVKPPVSARRPVTGLPKTVTIPDTV